MEKQIALQAIPVVKQIRLSYDKGIIVPSLPVSNAPMVFDKTGMLDNAFAFSVNHQWARPAVKMSYQEAYNHFMNSGWNYLFYYIKAMVPKGVPYYVIGDTYYADKIVMMIYPKKKENVPINKNTKSIGSRQGYSML